MPPVLIETVVPPAVSDRLTGLLLAVLAVLVILGEWGIAGWPAAVKPWCAFALIALFAIRVPLGRQAFVAAALLLTAILPAVDPGWRGTVARGLTTAAFIAAFFTVLTVLKTVAETSPAMRRAGAFLAAQKPGRRYIALTLGGQAFALLLNYGALQLLGALAMTSAGTEPDPEIRAIRVRRMLLAIERGLVSVLPWSPLSFAVAITTAVVPGTSWGRIILPCFVSGVILAGVGWALDTLLKPRPRTRPAPPPVPEGGWRTLLPLGALLAILIASVGSLHALTGVRVIGIVIVVVPVMAVVWLVLQAGQPAPLRQVGNRIRGYLFGEIQAFRGEMVLLMMAGYIGAVGAAILTPAMRATGLDIGALPPALLLVSFVWVIPLLGQVGMNPILAVSLIAPLLPEAEAMGVTPVAIAVALTAGWALSGATSPFTATSLLLGHYAGVSALQVGLRWNGLYALICAVLLSVWVYLYGFVL